MSIKLSAKKVEKSKINKHRHQARHKCGLKQRKRTVSEQFLSLFFITSHSALDTSSLTFFRLTSFTLFNISHLHLHTQTVLATRYCAFCNMKCFLFFCVFSSFLHYYNRQNCKVDVQFKHSHRTECACAREFYFRPLKVPYLNCLFILLILNEILQNNWIFENL